tara:strand:- start:2 stop:124 length:123 start_codon:yes stop_codon:yes gene_type:complete
MLDAILAEIVHGETISAIRVPENESFNDLLVILDVLCQIE